MSLAWKEQQIKHLDDLKFHKVLLDVCRGGRKYRIEPVESHENADKKTFVYKLKSMKLDVDYINALLTLISSSGVAVSLEHETNVMKKYAIKSPLNNENVYEISTIFDGAVVDFNDGGFKFSMNAEGYTGVKLKKLQQELQKRAALNKESR